ncbi:MAG: biopolymer transporter ExbD [Planctomycetaceae bacterium]|jgi:biopolymer transport protein ExbD|nr:biopolymer transporter ExbD [Planctomycetaceae bacterium]MBT6157749.1 biopolymer transporter ExbD [Planctomycetaceae bacterium]MBT6484878.1 biopolymer transporter ExbD [Planctomycetaceae bacterium]MBT6497650.1 biopolymer transporter ExbD [Planctomycetaceae bacterium]
MRIRNSHGQQSKPRRESMTTMIDVVFLLLIFFMLTMRILPTEGEFQVNMPGQPAAVVEQQELPPIEIRIRLVANEDGSLNRLQLGQRNLGNDRRAFERLSHELYALIGQPQLLSENTAIKIDSDYNLDYEHLMNAVGAASGRLDPKTGRLIRYQTPIEFVPARRDNDS